MAQSILAGRDRLPLGNGFELRLLSGLEVLQARREARELAGEDQEMALCSNACLLARALEAAEGQKPVFDSGRTVLTGLTAEEINLLAGRWDAFRRAVDPALEGLCPRCRALAEEDRCLCCGERLGAGTANPAFDLGRFYALKEGKTLD